ncbi:flagellar basal body P-ring formation chaperone FlgA [Pelomonas sp. SE-A7]|uniref:flagellar basal body P-ring formation chaperone FlgA n=1 Tax=Pelomonas sp. SE-A7 TaxID=3054953 RepID=UPI00259D1A13|nr:flagellar basal body P-ring formation chaperone FlgA [Pelomonas sp. SE-A7]MDM4764543.1 flagellar basal body P-ring formation chaperone FlgA [Pelomonas sp. SE-A7]
MVNTAAVRPRCAALLLAAVAGGSLAEPAGLDPAVLARVQQLALTAARAAAPAQARVEVQLGQLDPRLRLAPCEQVEPYMPAGLSAWGRSRIGLRCLKGATRWNVSLPMQVQVIAKVLVASSPLPAGTVIAQDQLQLADTDIAAQSGTVYTEAGQLLGRTLAKPLAAGEAPRSIHLKARQWFAAGEHVLVVAQGAGYAVSSEGQALQAGLEGQEVRVRFENGRIVTGRPVAERRVEVLL